MAILAFLGAGNMGSGMIKNLLKAGHEVAVFNRTRERALPLEVLGARLCDTPREAASGAEAVLASLMNDDVSRDAWTGREGVLSAELAPGALAIEASSLSPNWVRELGALLAGRMALVDCPVAGRPDASDAGELVVFAGGAAADVARAAPIVSAYSKKLTHFGPLGAGLTFKLIYNMLGASQVAAAAEALYACEMMGIDIKTAAAVFSDGNCASGHVIRHMAYMANDAHPVPPPFSSEGRIKDLSYALDLLASKNVRSLSGEATLKTFEHTRKSGMSKLSDSNVIDALRVMPFEA